MLKKKKAKSFSAAPSDHEQFELIIVLAAVAFIMGFIGLLSMGRIAFGGY
jgi:hypothetical protein